MRRRREGLTLIEVLIVCAVSAVLMVNVVSVFCRRVMRGKVTRTRNGMRILFTTMQGYDVEQPVYSNEGRF